jgi:hypothetical protein
MKKFTMYVGLNDKDTKKQEIATLEAYKVATNIFCEYTGGATIYEGSGIYTHNDGTIINEKTLVCIVFSEDPEAIKKTASALKIAFNQEAIAIESTETNSFFF